MKIFRDGSDCVREADPPREVFWGNVETKIACVKQTFLGKSFGEIDCIYEADLPREVLGEK